MATKAERVGRGVLLVTLVLGLAVGVGIGSCAAKRGDAEIAQEAFEQLRGTGNVPGIDEESATGYNGVGFQPSDSPPHCLPNGTVTYEVYDGAADMRYWVFRWPEDKGYGVVPRLMLGEDGDLVPYTPPRFEPEMADDGTVSADE